MPRRENTRRAKYVNERNTSCKSEGTSKAKASYLQLDIVPRLEQKKRQPEQGAGGPTGKGGREAMGSSRAAFNPPPVGHRALENLRSRF